MAWVDFAAAVLLAVFDRRRDLCRGLASTKPRYLPQMARLWLTCYMVAPARLPTQVAPPSNAARFVPCNRNMEDTLAARDKLESVRAARRNAPGASSSLEGSLTANYSHHQKEWALQIRALQNRQVWCGVCVRVRVRVVGFARFFFWLLHRRNVCVELFLFGTYM